MSNGDAHSGSASDSGAGDGVKIRIRCSNDSKFSVRIGLDSTVGEFKNVVAQKCDTPADQQRLIYTGRFLEDDQTLESYGLLERHTVHMLHRVVPIASIDTAIVVSPVPRGPNSTLSVPLPRVAGFTIDIPAESGTPHLFDARLPQLDQRQQELIQIRDMIFYFFRLHGVDPIVIYTQLDRHGVNDLMNDPKLFLDLIMLVPTVDEFMSRNPEIVNILNNRTNLNVVILRNLEFRLVRVRITSSYQGQNQVQDQSTTPSSSASYATTGSPVPNFNPLPNLWSPVMATDGAETNRSPRPNSAGGAVVPAIDQNPDVSDIMQCIFIDPQLTNRDLVLQEIAEIIQLFHGPTSPEILPQILIAQFLVFVELHASWCYPCRWQQPAGELGQTYGRTVLPEQQYASQLSQLQDMGFINSRENIEALQGTSGDVNPAVERLVLNLLPRLLNFTATSENAIPAIERFVLNMLP